MTNIITITDTSSHSLARIAVDVGFNCFEFQTVVNEQTVDVIASLEGFPENKEKPSWSGIPLLFPFPNRIRDGKYKWEGKEYTIPDNLAAHDGNGHAIHGFCFDRAWRVIEQGENFVTGEFQLSVDAPDRLELWPTDFILSVRYELNSNRLQSKIIIENPTDKSLPWGFGTHGYFKLPLGKNSSIGRCLAQAPVTKQWELIDCLPTGETISLPEENELIDGVYIDTVQLDDLFTGVKTTNKIVECLVMDEQAGLQISQRCDDSYREIVAFTPPWCDAVCLEPYTCPTDAINLQTAENNHGWQTLAPHSTHESWIDIQAGEIIV